MAMRPQVKGVPPIKIERKFFPYILGKRF